jgi:hypothetical protein
VKRPDAPRCPLHVAIRMTLVEEIIKTSFAGRKRLLGWRFRCPVEKCPRVETIQVEEPERELVLSKRGEWIPRKHKLKRKFRIAR